MNPQTRENSDEHDVANECQKKTCAIGFHLLLPFFTQRQPREFFEPRERGLAFRDALPVFLIQAENIEERGQQGLKVLPIVLVGSDTRLKSGPCLREQAFAVNLQQLGSSSPQCRIQFEVRRRLLRLDSASLRARLSSASAWASSGRCFGCDRWEREHRK